jgi:hypothetical protein
LAVGTPDKRYGGGLLLIIFSNYLFKPWTSILQASQAVGTSDKYHVLFTSEKTHEGESLLGATIPLIM